MIDRINPKGMAIALFLLGCTSVSAGAGAQWGLAGSGIAAGIYLFLLGVCAWNEG
jgi:hypothetical protein